MDSVGGDKGGNGGANTSEESKRAKRLARNRASARLRRMKKKNLVDTYEVEVGVLEASLEKLKSHQWGSGNSDILLEALSMERGQQDLPAEARSKFIKEILSQQQEQVEYLMEAQRESMMLSWFSRYKEKDGEQQNDDNLTPEQENEEAEIAKELNEILQLTPAQKVQMRKATEGADEEYRALTSIHICLSALKKNDWLMNGGVEECTNAFTSILNPQQFNKFLIWTDHNSDAIEQLDYINASPSGTSPANLPIFQFGVDGCGED